MRSHRIDAAGGYEWTSRAVAEVRTGLVEVADLRRNDGKPPAVLPASRRFDGGVERELVDL